MDEPVTTVVSSLDGAYLLMALVRLWRVISHDMMAKASGNIRLPEYGKACFKQRYEREIARIKARYPDALYLGNVNLGNGE